MKLTDKYSLRASNIGEISEIQFNDKKSERFFNQKVDKLLVDIQE